MSCVSARLVVAFTLGWMFKRIHPIFFAIDDAIILQSDVSHLYTDHLLV